MLSKIFTQKDYSKPMICIWKMVSETITVNVIDTSKGLNSDCTIYWQKTINVNRRA